MGSVVWMRNTLHLMIEKQKRIRFDDRQKKRIRFVDGRRRRLTIDQKNALDFSMGGGVER